MNSFIQFMKAINANQHPSQIALGLTLGMLLGLTPFWFPHTLLTLLLILVLRVNVSAVLVAWAVFTVIAYLFDPLFNSFGAWLLQLPGLVPMWTEMYNTAFWRFMSFNNTIVLGSIAVAYTLAVPFFGLSLVLIRIYRKRFLAWAQRFKIVRIIMMSDKASSLAGWFK
ncbi:hypothetical protein THIAE_09245 [Thiomicrospira aerophila AL3]|uniref:DUF2062 domain-containing protein n=1 Tax=Thiomicrospira aerophila AL3 TaxID=717772 RepID=W0DYI5_9GAMM|nr:TIGR03546 family protein [Thiomicrospira aerophila]AHF01916.1 hypothetical protein THIAE_09245 [Thiomicrospira aerophila AL3]